MVEEWNAGGVGWEMQVGTHESADVETSRWRKDPGVMRLTVKWGVDEGASQWQIRWTTDAQNECLSEWVDRKMNKTTEFEWGVLKVWSLHGSCCRVEKSRAMEGWLIGGVNDAGRGGGWLNGMMNGGIWDGWVRDGQMGSRMGKCMNKFSWWLN